MCVAEERDLVLIELFMPGLDTFSAAVAIRRLRPQARIAIFTHHMLPDQLLRARRLRLNGFILKRDGTEELFYAIKTILAEGSMCLRRCPMCFSSRPVRIRWKP